MSITLLAPATIGDWTYTWTDPEAVVHSLSTDTVAVLVGASGLRFPPSRHTEDPMPFAAGSRLRRVKTEARTLSFPLFIAGTTPGGLAAIVRDVAVWFDPIRGDGVLTSTTPDGVVRELICRLLNDLDIREDVQGRGGPLNRIAVVQLRAPTPYWQDTTDTDVEFALDEGQVAFFPWDGFFRLNASSLYASKSVLNDGDVEAWPVWTIDGPLVNPVITNLTTGEIISVSRTLVAGDVLTIDTRPNVKSVTDASGNNLFNALSATSSLWPLLRGANTVRVETTGADNVTSAVTLSFRQRFLGP